MVDALSPLSKCNSAVKTYTLHCIIRCRMKTVCLREDVNCFPGYCWRMAPPCYKSYGIADHAGQIQFKRWYRPNFDSFPLITMFWPVLASNQFWFNNFCYKTKVIKLPLPLKVFSWTTSILKIFFFHLKNHQLHIHWKLLANKDRSKRYTYTIEYIQSNRINRIIAISVNSSKSQSFGVSSFFIFIIGPWGCQYCNQKSF